MDIKKSKSRRRRIGAGFFVTVAVIAATAGLLFLLYVNRREEISISIPPVGLDERLYRKATADGVEYRYNTNLITMLLLGIDSEGQDTMGQSDFINLLILDRGEKRIRVVGISRDSMVPIRVFDAVGNDLGWNEQHLALAYAFGRTRQKGCLLAQEAVSKMFQGIPVIYYGAADLTALSVFHDLVGEITIQVTEDDLSGLDADFYKEGSLTLTSGNVERFVRSRDTEQEFSNQGRMRRQKLYMEAYLEKLKLLLREDFSGTVSRMETVFSNTVTNIGLNEISSFAEMALKYEFDPEQDYYIVQGTDQAGKYHDEFLVDEEALQQLVLQLFYKRKSM